MPGTDVERSVAFCALREPLALPGNTSLRIHRKPKKSGNQRDVFLLGKVSEGWLKDSLLFHTPTFLGCTFSAQKKIMLRDMLLVCCFPFSWSPFKSYSHIGLGRGQ